jgi:hypothetical protein
MQAKRGCLGSLTGCLTKMVLILLAALAFMYVVIVGLNPWALHIGGRSTPLLYWHGTGTLKSKDGRTYPLYLSWWPGKPGRHGGGRRDGKIWSADLDGTGWLCLAPGNIERMNVSGTMYGGYLNSDQSLFEFRVLEWRKPFQINYQNRGFFDFGGSWHGPLLAMDRPNEQGIKLNTGPFIDHATVTFQWATYDEFVSSCSNSGRAPQR